MPRSANSSAAGSRTARACSVRKGPRARPPERGDRPGAGHPIAELALQLDGPPQQCVRLVVVGGGGGCLAGALQDLRFLGGIGRHGEGLLEKGQRLVERPQRARALGGRPEGDPRLGGEGVGLRSLRGVLLGRQVVAGQAAGELVAVEVLEEAGRGEVAPLAVGPGERVVGNLPDQGLDEGVLAALRAPRIRLEGEELAAHERPQARLELVLGDPRDGREPGEREGLAEDGRIGDEDPLVGREPVQAGGDERRERLGDREVREVPDRLVGAVLEGQPAVGEEHPDRLDGVQRDAVGAGDDGPDRGLRQARAPGRRGAPASPARAAARGRRR